MSCIFCKTYKVNEDDTVCSRCIAETRELLGPAGPTRHCYGCTVDTYGKSEYQKLKVEYDKLEKEAKELRELAGERKEDVRTMRDQFHAKAKEVRELRERVEAFEKEFQRRLHISDEEAKKE